MLKGIIPLNFNMITQSVKKTDTVLTLKSTISYLKPNANVESKA